MVNYYTISYKLREHGSNGVEPAGLVKPAASYVAHEIAESEQDAVMKLKAEFSMIDVEVVSVSGRKTASDEDFASGNIT